MTTHALYPVAGGEPVTCCYRDVTKAVRASDDLALVTCAKCKARLQAFPQLRNAMRQATREPRTVSR